MQLVHLRVYTLHNGAKPILIEAYLVFLVIKITLKRFLEGFL